MSVHYNILFRACDKVESVHSEVRPFALNKTQIIKVCFNSIYRSIQEEDYKIRVFGDDLSIDLLNFFQSFDDVVVDNQKLGSAKKSLQTQIDFALNLPEDEWVYMCEDDY